MYAYILYDTYLHFNHIVIEWQQKSQQIRPNPWYVHVIPLLYVASFFLLISWPPLLYHYMYCHCIQACQPNTLPAGASNPALSHEIARNPGTVTMASDDTFTTSKFVNLLVPSDLPRSTVISITVRWKHQAAAQPWSDRPGWSCMETSRHHVQC